jgi:hypothetical protein
MSHISQTNTCLSYIFERPSILRSGQRRGTSERPFDVDDLDVDGRKRRPDLCPG